MERLWGRTVAYLRWESSLLRKRTRRPGLRQGRKLKLGRRLATTAPSPTTRPTPKMQRLMELGYVKKITKAQAVNYFSEPIVSKLGLIVNVKRRIIVDALRSGANKKARCPERILLPRTWDVSTMASDLKSLEPQLLE